MQRQAQARQKNLPEQAGMSTERTLALVHDLRQLPAETSWVEFKENNTDALMIGKLISAHFQCGTGGGSAFCLCAVGRS